MRGVDLEGQIIPIRSLQFDNISLSHDGGHPVLQNASFDFPAGDVIWLKSDEGAGKSTLLNALAGLHNPTGGRFLLNGEDVVPMSFEEFLPYRLSIGYSFDYGGLINNRTLRDNLLLPLLYHHLCTPEEAHLRVDDLLRRFEVAKYANERPAHVPGRVRKMVVVLRSIVTHPTFLLLDDPSVGLSDDILANFISWVEESRKAGFLNTIIVSSFDDRMVRPFEHTVVALESFQLFGSSPFERKAANI